MGNVVVGLGEGNGRARCLQLATWFNRWADFGAFVGTKIGAGGWTRV